MLSTPLLQAAWEVFCGFSDSVLPGLLRVGPVIIPSFLREQLR